MSDQHATAAPSEPERENEHSVLIRDVPVTVDGALRKSVSVGEDAIAAEEWLSMLVNGNPSYWTRERAFVTLFAHRENHMARIENVLREVGAWDEAQAEVFEGGNCGWSQIAVRAIYNLHAKATDRDV